MAASPLLRSGILGMRSPEGEAQHSPNASLEGLRVLLVEDSWQVADALKLLLEKLGVIVSGPVATVAEAQALAADARPSLAIVDVNLKGEMAYGLLDWLNRQQIEVIVISGYADLPRSLRQFAPILHKPFTATALITTLRRIADRLPRR